MDVTQQREQLYRKLETLTSQGILISPNLNVVTSPPPVSVASTGGCDSGEQSGSETPSESSSLPIMSPTDPPRRKADTAKWKHHMSQNKASTLPLNLISATNQQKVSIVNKILLNIIVFQTIVVYFSNCNNVHKVDYNIYNV